MITTDNDYNQVSTPVSVSESSTTTSIATESGNLVSGSYSQTVTITGSYSMTESTVAGMGGGGTTTGTGSSTPSFIVTETGNLTTSMTETGNSVTAAYTQTQSGSDVYTMVESGTNSLGNFTETVTGTSTPTLIENGNSANQIYTRTISDTDVYSRTDGGTGATFSSSTTGTLSSTLTETSDARAGLLSQSEAGSDRYSLLQNFVNVANTTSSNQPGNMDYLTFGEPFVDPTIEELQRQHVRALLDAVDEQKELLTINRALGLGYEDFLGSSFRARLQQINELYAGLYWDALFGYDRPPIIDIGSDLYRIDPALAQQMVERLRAEEERWRNLPTVEEPGLEFRLRQGGIRPGHRDTDADASYRFVIPYRLP